jgi:putative transposase
MDLRERVARAWDAGEDADTIADTYAVSRAWVHRLIQRRRATGSLAPRRQTVFRKRAFAGQEDRLRALVVARPDQTLVELRDALQSSASLSSLWRALARLDITIKKNRPRGRTAPAGRRR